VTIFENVTVGTTLHKFSATDADTGINKLFTYVTLIMITIVMMMKEGKKPS